MSDELAVGKWTVTLTDGRVLTGDSGIIRGEAVERIKQVIQLTHNCRAEPHCMCDHNAWYHRDVDDAGTQSAECGMQGCSCTNYTRCYAFVRRD